MTDRLLTDAERSALAAVLTNRGMAQGDADMSLHFMMPIFVEVVKRHQLQAYVDGERGGMTRSYVSPGNGDMGG